MTQTVAVKSEVRAKHEDLITFIAKAAIQGSSRDMQILEKNVEDLEKLSLLSDVANTPRCCDPNAAKALWFDFTEGEGRHCGWIFFDRALRFLYVEEISPSKRQ